MVDPRKPFKKMSDRPFDVYLIVTFIAYFVGIMTLLLLVVMLDRETTFKNILQHPHMLTIYVWALISAVTAFFVAYRLDSLGQYESNKVKMISLTLLGASFQGIITTAIIVFAFAHTFHNGSFNFVTLGPEDMGRLTLYTFMGFFIGFLLFMTGHFNAMMCERRRHERFPVRKTVSLSIGDETSEAALVNISEGGALINTGELKKAADKSAQLVIGDDIKIGAEIVKLKKNLMHLKFVTDNQWDKIKTLFQLRQALAVP